MTNKLSPNSNLLWESSRMMLPEHTALLRQHEAEKVKEEKPDYDVQFLEQLLYTIERAYHDKSLVKLKYYDRGSFCEVVGRITAIDPEKQSIQLTTEMEDLAFNFSDLTSVGLW